MVQPEPRQRHLPQRLDRLLLRRASWGQGYATEAAEALLSWAFDALDLNRVQGETDTRNLGSARVLEKLAFTREGTLREDCIVDGEVSDTWVYGLLRREWLGRSVDPAGAGVVDEVRGSGS